MSRLLVAAALVAGAVLPISAQDPTKTLPEAYKVQLDNSHVRVVRVHYAAGAKLPEHEHPAGTTVYVYLNDSEGVVFAHSGRSNRAVTRPAVKARSVRIASGPEEHHTAENPAATPSDFLRIWLKTEAEAGPRLMRRIPPAELPAGATGGSTDFVNKQLRLTRHIIADRTQSGIKTSPGQPALLVSLPSGDTQWIDGGKEIVLTGPGEYLQIDLRTAPK